MNTDFDDEWANELDKVFDVKGELDAAFQEEREEREKQFAKESGASTYTSSQVKQSLEDEKVDSLRRERKKHLRALTNKADAEIIAYCIEQRLPKVEMMLLLKHFGISLPDEIAKHFPRVGSKKGKQNAKPKAEMPKKHYTPPIWRIPEINSRRIQRPSYFGLEHFRAWVHGEATFFRKKITKANEVVTGNAATQTLYYMRTRPHRDVALRLLMSASVFVTTYADSKWEAPPVFASDFLAQPVLHLGDRSFVGGVAPKELTPHEVKIFEIFFKTDAVTRAQVQRNFLNRFPRPEAAVVRAEKSPDYDVIVVTQKDPAMFPPVPVLVRQTAAVQALVKPPRDVVEFLDRPSFLPFDVRPVIWTKKKKQEKGKWPRVVGNVKLHGNVFVKQGVVYGEQVVLQALKKYEQPIVSFGTLFTTIILAETWAERLRLLAVFVTSNKVVYKKFKHFITELPELVLQGETKEDPWFNRFWTVLVSSGVISFFEGSKIAMGEYLIEPILSFVGKFKFSLEKAVCIKLADQVISVFAECIRRIKACIDQRSMSPLWGPEWDPVIWCRYARAYMAHYGILAVTGQSRPDDLNELKKLRELGEVPEWWTVPVVGKVYIERLEEHFSAAGKLLGYFRESSSVSAEIRRVRQLLEKYIETQRVSVYAASERMVPFFMMMYSAPGTGKTVLEQDIRMGIASLFGYDKSSQGKYDWVVGANFQTGLTHMSWAVVADDVDHGIAPPMAGTHTHIQTLTLLVNNKPYEVEQAGVETKGKIFASPSYVAYITNFPDGLVVSNTREPEAFWRRVDVYVRVAVKPEYAKSGSGKLDPLKAATAETHRVHDLYVSFYDAAANVGKKDKTVVPLSAEVKMDLPEFMIMVKEIYTAKLKRQFELLKSHSLSEQTCPNCGLAVLRECGCKPVLQGAAPSAPIVMELEEESDDDVPPPVDCCRRFRDDAVEMQRAVKKDFPLKKIALLTGAVAIMGIAYNVMEKSRAVLQGRVGNATGLVPETWLRAEQKNVPGLPTQHVTWTVEELIASVRKSIVTIKGPHTTVRAVCLGQGVFVTTTHVFIPKIVKESRWDDVVDEAHCKITYEGAVHNARFDKINMRVLPSNKELCLVHFPEMGGVFSVATRIPQVIDSSVGSFDELTYVYPDGLVTAKKNSMMTYGSDSATVVSSSVSSQDGDCGTPVLGKIGDYWKVVGIHFAGIESQLAPASFAALISHRELNALAMQVSTRLHGLYTPAKMYNLQHVFDVGQYPVMSEVLAAISHHDAVVFPYGTINPPLSRVTPRTKLKETLFKEDFQDVIDEWCGEKDYWRFPNFRGSMVDEKWVSPYTNAFAAQNRCLPDHKYMWTALACYFNGADKLDRNGYATLSEEEVLSGVPGSVISRVDEKTSVGPPYNRKKFQYMSVETGESYMDERLWEMVDEIEECIKNGIVVQPVSVCTLKDEPVKRGKFPRVFNCLPFSFNFVLKKHLAPIVAFMRANWQFFEGTVGINMTSSQSNKIIHQLEAVGGAFGDFDAVAMDKAFDGIGYWFLVLFFTGVARLLGLDADATFYLLMSVKNTVYSMKNDMFSWWWNPSGCIITVELNGVRISLCTRYIYYSERGECLTTDQIRKYQVGFLQDPVFRGDFDFSFRRRVALVTYGDDNLRKGHVAERELLRWRDELGITMTDSNKESVPRPKTVEEIEYLKRTFVFDQAFNGYKTPISKKSMARMLQFKKYSTLSDVDHAAIVLTEVLREAVYHGSEFYDRLLERVALVARKYGLEDNPYYRVYDFAHWIRVAQTTGFAAWVPPERHVAAVDQVLFFD